MKNIGLIVLTGLLMVVGFLKIQEIYTLKENVLYHQIHLKLAEDVAQDQYEMMTRSKAIETVKTIFLEGLDIDLGDPSLEMHINLYKDAQNKNRYRWSMHWNNKELTQIYTCNVDCNTGKIVYLYKGTDMNSAQKESYFNRLDEQQVREILEPFAIANNIAMEEYVLDQMWRADYQSTDSRYQLFCFRNQTSSKESFIVEIDAQTLCLNEYTYKEKTEM